MKHITFHVWNGYKNVPDASGLLELMSLVESFQADAKEVRGKKIVALLHCRLTFMHIFPLFAIFFKLTGNSHIIHFESQVSETS